MVATKMIKVPFKKQGITQGFAIGTASLLILANSPTAIAQEVNAALNPNSAQQNDIEVIQVSGVRNSLEDALNVKRSASSIVDAISASDIDSLPALDLGEALQALPGIQLNTEDGSRNSEINLRGLGSGFVLTTAEGQSFATPSRAESLVGNTNPFGAFEPSVFDGITVVKSPTADLQEGGIAGIVDQKLQRALAKPDGRYSVNLGTRYEELADQFDTEFRVSGSKHLIKDKVAVAFKVAGSEQNFRRDTANWDQRSFVNNETANLDEFIARHGLEENAAVSAPTRVRQVSENQSGNRISATGNIEWQATDYFKLGANLLYTKRTLDESNQEDFSVSTRPLLDARFSRGDNRGQAIQTVDLIGNPIRLESEGENPIYTVDHVAITNATFVNANRIFSSTEEAKGLFVYGDYLTENWEIGGIVSHSQSTNEFINQGIDVRHQTSANNNAFQPTGITAEINTGNGDLNQGFTRITGLDTFTYSGDWDVPPLSRFDTRLDRSVNQGRDVRLFVNGRVDRPERDFSSFEFNANRFLDLGSETFTITSAKFGVRRSVEELVNDDFRIGAGGINTSGLNEEAIFSNTPILEGQAEFFNGDFPGAFSGADGWRVIRARELRNQFQENITVLPGAIPADDTGFFIRTTQGRNEFFANNFTAEQTISAAYGLVNFEGQLGSVFYSGNAGVRFVRTENDLIGAGLEGDEIVELVTENNYNHALPSINASFELKEDLILRAAYSEGLVRPNLRSLTPAGEINSGLNQVRIDLPESEVEPYTSKSYDLSLEWYNRDGSAVSVGIFQKQITNLFVRRRVCPVGEEAQFGGLIGQLEEVPQADGNTLCREIGSFVDPDTGDVSVNRDAIINQSFNFEGTIDVTGYELAIQQKLDFLPYPWNGFGGVFNYTFVDTETSEDVPPIERIAPRSYNLIGYWENDGISIRFTYNWQDVKLINAGGGTANFLGTDRRDQSANGRLDLSASYRLTKQTRLNFRAFNLNNRQEFEFTGGNEDAINRVRFAGRQYQLNVSYNF